MTGLIIFFGFGCDSGSDGDEADTTPPTVTKYTLSGTITAASNTAIDSDVNDPKAAYTPNDSAEQAQTVPTPVTLGGYVNQPQTGQEGRSFDRGDINDVFRAELLAGERIVLNIAAPILDADLDLYLYDAASLELIDSAIDRFARTESLSAPDAGTYLIQVITELGASNYTLTIGQAQNSQNRSSLRLSQNFVPGEVIVKSSKSQPIAAGTANAIPAPGMRHLAGGPGRAQLFAISADNIGDQTIQSQSAGLNSQSLLLPGASMNARTREKLETLYKIKTLRSRSDIAAACPNYIHQALQSPNDEYYPLQWHYPLINLPDAWEITRGRQNVKVAVIDTGVIVDHPDLAGKITADSYDFISDPDRAMDGDGIDSDPNDTGDDTQGSSSFHGTHVAGTVAAATDNDTGVAGVAWNCRIMAIRTLGKGDSGTTYDILQGVRYAAGLENDSGTTPDEPADIINLSLGGRSFSQTEQDVLAQARAAGVIIVAAAGNSAENAPSYPAAYDGVISVSAVDINANPAPYSNFGPSIDVAAPGGDFSGDLNGDGYVDGVLSTGGDDSDGKIQNVYTFFQGTSMAAPHMAGVAALMKSVRPDLTPDDLDAFLQSGAIVRDLGPAGRDDRYGYGLIDASLAVRAARDDSAPTVLNISPGSISLGSSLSSTTLAAARMGPGDLSITQVTADAQWLTVSAAETDENGLGTYTVTADRERLSDGAYNAVITFASSENTVEVPVSLRISSTTLAPDAGFHYVLLVDSQSDETVDQVSVAGADSRYKYQFTGVEPGKYRIYAGTDSDNDFNIGDAGEAIGAYLSTDQPTILDLDSDRSGLDFVTEFNVKIPEAENSGLVVPLSRSNNRALKKVKQ
ncbi:MAG: S8 family serine peptidase [Desulfobacterales bacterium]|nr:S8 family serine peptidase [Desulfobacterales bacterium]